MEEGGGDEEREMEEMRGEAEAGRVMGGRGGGRVTVVAAVDWLATCYGVSACKWVAHLRRLGLDSAGDFMPVAEHRLNPARCLDACCASFW